MEVETFETLLQNPPTNKSELIDLYAPNVSEDYRKDLLQLTTNHLIHWLFYQQNLSYQMLYPYIDKSPDVQKLAMSKSFKDYVKKPYFNSDTIYQLNGEQMFKLLAILYPGIEDNYLKYYKSISTSLSDEDKDEIVDRMFGLNYKKTAILDVSEALGVPSARVLYWAAVYNNNDFTTDKPVEVGTFDSYEFKLLNRTGIMNMDMVTGFIKYPHQFMFTSHPKVVFDTIFGLVTQQPIPEYSLWKDILDGYNGVKYNYPNYGSFPWLLGYIMKGDVDIKTFRLAAVNVIERERETLTTILINMRLYNLLQYMHKYVIYITFWHRVGEDSVSLRNFVDMISWLKSNVPDWKFKLMEEKSKVGLHLVTRLIVDLLIDEPLDLVKALP